jgi:polysaccharide deacetylase family protein (PEP-CTERM system associated)
MVTHCFSVDVEGFCESMAESFPIPAGMTSGGRELAEIERNVYETLAFLDTRSVKGTFFVLGKLAESLPKVARAIAENGHEIASHSFEHLRLFSMSRAQAREAVCRSRKVLQDASQAPVDGFRAPDFSITKGNLYVLDLIQEAGYRYDSSLYPIRSHDVYGVPGLDRWIQRLPNGLVEYPLSVFEIGGFRLPALGGGYFRLYPLVLTRWILRSIEKEGRPAMFYIHPYELGSVCPLVPNLSRSRRFRHYVSRVKTRRRFDCLFQRHRFGRAADVLRAEGFLD